MADPFTEVLVWFGRHSAWLLLPAAAIIFTWAIEAKKREDLEKEEWERRANVSKIVKIFAFVGMVYGLFLMIGAVMTEITGYSPSLLFKKRWGPLDIYGNPQNIVNHFTTIVYFITGMVMFFKPFKDVPFASLVSLAVASGITILAMLYIPDSAVGSFIIEHVIELKWLLIIIFVIVLAITFALSKVSFTLMTKFSKLISMPPFAIIYGSFVVLQSVLLLAGFSLVMW